MEGVEHADDTPAETAGEDSARSGCSTLGRRSSWQKRWWEQRPGPVQKPCSGRSRRVGGLADVGTKADAADPADAVVTDLPSLHHTEIATAWRCADASRCQHTAPPPATGDTSRPSARPRQRDPPRRSARHRRVPFRRRRIDSSPWAVTWPRSGPARRHPAQQSRPGQCRVHHRHPRGTQEALLDAWLERGVNSDSFLFRTLTTRPMEVATALPMSDRAVARPLQLHVANLATWLRISLGIRCERAS